MAVPYAARAAPRAPRNGGSCWVVSLLRAPSDGPQRTFAGGARVDALRRPGPCARGRRRMGSVGGWPLAIPITVASGGNRDGGSLSRGKPPEPVPHPRGVRVVPSCWLTPSPLVYAPVLPWGTWSGIADARQGTQRRLARPASPGALKQVTKSLRGPQWPPEAQRPQRAPRLAIVTWLILPVVICLSQRLSHACLSISNYTAKLRMAHYISYRLFDSTLLLG